MQTPSVKRLALVTVLVTVWVDALLLGYLFDLATVRELLWTLWAASLVLLPLVVLDAKRTDNVSWPLVGGLLLPGLNLLTGLAYSYGRFSDNHTGASTQGRHGTLLFVAVLTTGLSLIVAPYVFGPVAVLCGVWIRSRYDRPQGALLLTASGVTILVGLLLHTAFFTFVRPGPVL